MSGEEQAPEATLPEYSTKEVLLAAACRARGGSGREQSTRR